MLDEERWLWLMATLCGHPPPGELFARILTAYSESHRHYHTASHIAHCLLELERVRDLLAAPAEVEAAVWLHDLVYQPTASDNEKMSAEAAKEILCEAGCPAERAEHVGQLILLTRHVDPPATTDEKIILDVDLAVLGQPPRTFQEYEENIRKEYRHLSDEAYQSRRRQLLEGFLARPAIYHTPPFRDRYEEVARENIRRAILQGEEGHRHGI